ncbi:MAG TPA: VOC family protein [Steroidobacteraceae bacterium]|jgi:4-hydroxyphenylpyruvate dioxygenase-like putative hemolysin|nr:VOC family protein [Steroidobacteraceae bacterium]
MAMNNFRFANGKIDHIAIAVRDIESAINLYQQVFGFELMLRREIHGKFSGMLSAELNAGDFSIVLVQGTDPESQVSRYIDEYGPGVQHVAVSVEDIDATASALTVSGAQFATNIIEGDGLRQIFTKRDSNTGMMFEFIERKQNVKGFQKNNIQKLFDQLESSSAY